MPEYYPVRVMWLDHTQTTGNAVGNNAAWLCKCNMILLGPHEESVFQIGPCPFCGRRFRIRRGQGPNVIDRVEEVDQQTNQ